MLLYVPTLVTDRLLLRQISTDDMDNLLPISFYNGMPIHTQEGIEEKLKRIEADIKAGKCIHWGIAHKLHGNIMGTVGFYRGFTNKTGEIGYVLNEAFRGQGFMEEALKSAIYYGFSQLELETIIAYTDGDNHSSIRVLLKTGFTEIVSDNPEYRKWIKYK